MAEFLWLIGILAWLFSLVVGLTSLTNMIGLILSAVLGTLGAVCLSGGSIINALNKLKPADAEKKADQT